MKHRPRASAGSAAARDIRNGNITDKSNPPPQQRWAIRFAVRGDLRFLSHHDLVRAVEKTAARAGLPVCHSLGFNPHPLLSLVCPRPVGVTSEDDLAILALGSPAEALDAAELLHRLNEHAPRGLCFLKAEVRKTRRPPQPCKVRYVLPVPEGKQEMLRGRMAELAKLPSWPVKRPIRFNRGAPVESPVVVDMKPLLADMKLENGNLRLTLRAEGGRWSRPAEIMELLGLDQRVDLAAMVRTELECEETT